MDFYSTVAEVESKGLPFVIVTLASVQISAPADPGAQALVGEKGLLAGSIGGGKLEACALEMAMAMLENGATREAPLKQVEWSLKEDVGMTCGGIVQLVFHSHFPRRWNIAIFGAGHVCQALVPVLLTLDCWVDVFDPRGDWLEKLPRSERLATHKVESYGEGVGQVRARDFVVCLTMGHCHDLPVLVELLQRKEPPRFVGVIGSQAKARTLRRQLGENGVRKEALNRLECPVGMAIGSNQPAEIAISIAASLMQGRDALVKYPNSNSRLHDDKTFSL